MGIIFAYIARMKQFTTFLFILCCCSLLSSSCFLIKKIQGPPVPPPPEEETLPPPKKEETNKPSTTKESPAPFDVPEFGKEVRKPVYDVALFAPLNLDEVTRDTGFSINNRTPLPGVTLSALEFYEGALLAMDTLQKQGIRLRLHVYDTRSSSNPLFRVLNDPRLDSADLLLGGSVNANELKQISAFAQKNKINFVSATYPNDAGITQNPFLIIVNSTLHIHCEAIQDFAQQKFSNKQITVIYRNTPQEKQNLEYMQKAYQQMSFSRKVPLQPFEWTNNTTTADLIPHLSKEKNNVIILTSLYPEVALSIIGQLKTIATQYMINIIGMPTLDGLTDLKKPDYNGINIYYSTPFPYVNLATDPAIKQMMWKFFYLYRSRPSDIAIKAYESLFYFGHLLHKDGLFFNAKINDPSARLLTDFHFAPIYTSDKTRNPADNAKASAGSPDYFENIRLYFMRVRDGKVVPAN